LIHNFYFLIIKYTIFISPLLKKRPGVDTPGRLTIKN
jgi:hypothetical protein